MTITDLAPAVSAEPRPEAPIRPDHPALALLPGAVAIGLVIAAVSTRRDSAQVVESVLVGVWVVCGAIVTLRRGTDRLGPLMLYASAVGALGAAAGAGHGDSWNRTAAVVAALLPALGLHLLLSLPDGTLPRRAERAALLTGYIGAGAVAVALAVNGHPTGWAVVPEGLVAVVIGAVGANARYRRMTVAERRRMQWFGCAVAFVVEVLVVSVALRLLAHWPHRLGTVTAVATVVLPIALAAGTSSQLVARVDRLLTWSVSLAGLSGVVVGVYLLIVLGLGRPPSSSERSLLLLSMAAAGVAAALYLPARQRLARFSTRLVYGERAAPDEVLRTFGARLSRAIPLDELLLQLAESLRKTLELKSAQVWTGTDGILERTVSVPDVPPARLTLTAAEEPVVARAGVCGPAWARIWLPQLVEGAADPILRAVPVTNSGELLGLIVVDRPAGAEQFNASDEQMLADLARQVGLALHNVRLDSALQASLDEVRRQAAELQASRARIVAASDAARRQIERNLHDGAQQHLVALAVNIRLAKQLTDADPEQAKSMLEQLGTDLQEAIQQLRELAHGIYPPLLMDQGLPAALSAALGRFPLPADLVADDIGRYPPDVEAAVYFCMLEALQNAAKHAGEAATAVVTLRQQPEGLMFSVADTGAGFDTSVFGGGTGFMNMNDRVGAIGGSLRVESAPGRGTTVSGLIPTHRLIS